MPGLGENVAAAAEQCRVRQLAEAGALLGLVAVFGACGAGQKDSAPVMSTDKAPLGSASNPYVGGEKVDVMPGLTARYDGSRLIFSSKSLTRYLHARDHHFIKIVMHGEDDSQQIWIENGQGMAEPNPLGATQTLKCQPPPGESECALTVVDRISNYDPKHGVFKSRTSYPETRYLYSNVSVSKNT